MNHILKDKVCTCVENIPKGKVATYGLVALLCGHPGAARVVGQIAHFGPSQLPWHRLVKANGQMASGFVPGGPDRQALLLQEEGIPIKNYRIVNIEKYLWKT